MMTFNIGDKVAVYDVDRSVGIIERVEDFDNTLSVSSDGGYAHWFHKKQCRKIVKKKKAKSAFENFEVKIIDPYGWFKTKKIVDSDAQNERIGELEETVKSLSDHFSEKHNLLVDKFVEHEKRDNSNIEKINEFVSTLRKKIDEMEQSQKDIEQKNNFLNEKIRILCLENNLFENKFFEVNENLHSAFVNSFKPAINKIILKKKLA